MIQLILKNRHENLLLIKVTGVTMVSKSKKTVIFRLTLIFTLIRKKFLMNWERESSKMPGADLTRLSLLTARLDPGKVTQWSVSSKFTNFIPHGS